MRLADHENKSHWILPCGLHKHVAAMTSGSVFGLGAGLAQ